VAAHNGDIVPIILMKSANSTACPMIHNNTRNTSITQHERFCISTAQLGKGLMFTRPRGEFCLVLVLRPLQRIALHMFFVFAPIDVIFADEHYQIVDLKPRFRPFALYTSRKSACYAIELPVGTIAKSKTRIGDVLSFETSVDGAYDM